MTEFQTIADCSLTFKRSLWAFRNLIKKININIDNWCYRHWMMWTIGQTNNANIIIISRMFAHRNSSRRCEWKCLRKKWNQITLEAKETRFISSCRLFRQAGRLIFFLWISRKTRKETGGWRRANERTKQALLDARTLADGALADAEKQLSGSVHNRGGTRRVERLRAMKRNNPRIPITRADTSGRSVEITEEPWHGESGGRIARWIMQLAVAKYINFQWQRSPRLLLPTRSPRCVARALNPAILSRNYRQRGNRRRGDPSRLNYWPGRFDRSK